MYNFDYDDGLHVGSPLESMKFNIQMAEAAGKYAINVLGNIARRKFETGLSKGWREEWLHHCVRYLYTRVEGGDRSLEDLCDVVAEVTARHADALMKRGDFLSLLSSCKAFRDDFERVNREWRDHLMPCMYYDGSIGLCTCYTIWSG
jgi:hypothetical protein